MMKGKSEENSAIQATFVLRATELLCRRQQRERKSFSFVLFFITLGVWLWCFLVLRVVPSLFRQLNEPAFGGAGIIARTYFRCHWEIDKKWQKPFPSSRRPVSLNRASNWFGFFYFFASPLRCIEWVHWFHHEWSEKRFISTPETYPLSKCCFTHRSTRLVNGWSSILPAATWACIVLPFTSDRDHLLRKRESRTACVDDF